MSKRNRYIAVALAIGACVIAVSGCARMFAQPGSPALQPFVSAAPPAEAVTLQEPLTVGLVWLRPPAGAPAVPARAEEATLEMIRSHFAEGGKRLKVIRVDTVTSVDLSALRQLGQAHGLTHVLLVAPTVQEVKIPTRLRYGRGGYSLGTRTESFVLVEAVGLGLETGSPVFAGKGNGAAALEELDYGPLGPWYPRISRGAMREGFGSFIYPEGREFQPDEVRAVALKDAIAVLLADLDRVGMQKVS